MSLENLSAGLVRVVMIPADRLRPFMISVAACDISQLLTRLIRSSRWS